MSAYGFSWWIFAKQARPLPEEIMIQFRYGGKITALVVITQVVIVHRGHRNKNSAKCGIGINIK